MPRRLLARPSRRPVRPSRKPPSNRRFSLS
jgi:hypothetical protein